MEAKTKEFKIFPEFGNAYDYTGTERGAKMHSSRYYAGKIDIYEKTDLVSKDTGLPVYRLVFQKISSGWVPGLDGQWF